MIQRIDFNPYAYLSAPRVEGINPVNQKTLFAEALDAEMAAISEAYRFKEEIADNGFQERALAVFGPRFFIQHEPTDYKALLNELLAVGDDYDNAISVVIGQMNADKHFDYGDVESKLAGLKEIADSADYTGKSDAEIVTAIARQAI